MIRFVFLSIFLFVSTNAYSQYGYRTHRTHHVQDGTLVLSSSNRLIGRIANRITGQKNTHIGIVIDGYVYDQDWPVAHKTPVSRYGKRGWTVNYYAPVRPYSAHEVNMMRQTAESRLGERYSLRGFWNRSSKGTSDQWCSPYVAHVLNSSGRYNLNSHDAWSPGNIHNRVYHDYNFQYQTRH
jgi:hypothetical protein